MKRKLLIFCVICLGCLSCDRRLDIFRANPRQRTAFYDPDVLITPSAEGWQVKPGPPPEDGANTHPTTVLLNPKGTEYDIGQTQYPDVTMATLFCVDVRELNARFLVLYMPPVASGGSEMAVIHIDEDDNPAVSALIGHHYEWRQAARSRTARVFFADCPPHGALVRDILFVDSDDNGVPELMEDFVGRFGGTITYHRFDGRTFKPLWVEEYEPTRRGGHQMKLVSRKRADAQ